MAFIETPRFPEQISYGSQGGPSYSTDIVTVKSGFEARNANWTESRHAYQVSFDVRNERYLSKLVSYFHAMQGRANTFRFKDKADYKSVDVDQTISATDQTIGTGDGSAVAFQLIKSYTQGSLTTVRDITKPVSGTLLLSIDDVSQAVQFSIDTTTGIITFDANQTGSCTGATTADPVQLTFTSHGLTTGDSVYLTGFTGDYTPLNNNRYFVTVIDANNFTVDVDSSAYAAYSSNGGAFNTIPQTGEVIKAGYEFDVPCRFDTDTLTRTFIDYETGEISAPIVEVKI